MTCLALAHDGDAVAFGQVWLYAVERVADWSVVSGRSRFYQYRQYAQSSQSDPCATTRLPASYLILAQAARRDLMLRLRFQSRSSVVDVPSIPARVLHNTAQQRLLPPVAPSSPLAPALSRVLLTGAKQTSGYLEQLQGGCSTVGAG